MTTAGETAAPPTQAPLDMGGLPALLGFLIRIAQLQLYSDFFRELQGFELRPGELSVLELVHRNPGVRQGQVAEALSIRAPHMTKLVRRFEAQGLLTRAPGNGDRRAVQLHLTDAGRDVLSVHWDRLSAYEIRRHSRLSRDEERALARLLRKLTGLDGPDAIHRHPEGGLR